MRGFFAPLRMTIHDGSRSSHLQLLGLLEKERYRGGVLEDAAGGVGGGACDCDGVGFGGEGQGVGGADAISAAGREEQGDAKECEGEELRRNAVVAGAQG